MEAGYYPLMTSREPPLSPTGMFLSGSSEVLKPEMQTLPPTEALAIG